MQDAWDYLIDRWESDSLWRSQIVLAVIVGAIGFAWALAELATKRAVTV